MREQCASGKDFAKPDLSSPLGRPPNAARSLFYRIAPPISIALLGLAAAAAIGTWKYGSVSAAILAARGYALIVDTGDVPSVWTADAENSVPVRVRNLKSVPVTIMGAATSCSCSSVLELPVTVPPRESIDLPVVVTATESDIGGRLSAKVVLHVDVASPTILFRVPARDVVGPQVAAGSIADP